MTNLFGRCLQRSTGAHRDWYQIPAWPGRWVWFRLRERVGPNAIFIRMEGASLRNLYSWSYRAEGSSSDARTWWLIPPQPQARFKTWLRTFGGPNAHNAVVSRMARSHHSSWNRWPVWGLSLELHRRSHSLMSDLSTASWPILDLIAGGCWDRCQLHNDVWSAPPRTLFIRLQG